MTRLLSLSLGYQHKTRKQNDKNRWGRVSPNKKTIVIMATKLEKQIIQRMDGKRTFGQIGQEFGLSYQTIKTIAAANGIERPKSKSKSVRLEASVIKALTKGKTVKEVAAKYSMTQKTVRELAITNDFSINGNRNAKILKGLETANNCAELARELGVSAPTVRKIAKANNIKLEGRGFPAKTERNDELVGLLKEGNMTYPQLAAKFGVTKQRIYQFAKANGISRWKLSRELHQKTAIAIEADYKAGVSYEDMKEKYNLANVNFAKMKMMPLATRYRKDRDAKIVAEYKKKTANAVLKSTDPAMDNPDRLTSQHTIYGISSKHGYKKYPNIGNRNAGGVFEAPKTIKMIKKLREKNKLSFNEIAVILNSKDLKTPMGKEYTGHNLRFKYQGIVKHNA